MSFSKNGGIFFASLKYDDFSFLGQCLSTVLIKLWMKFDKGNIGESWTFMQIIPLLCMTDFSE